MDVIQIRLKTELKEDINHKDVQEIICKFFDTNLIKSISMEKFHYENKYKFYCFDGLYPVEKDKIYKKGKNYSITVRTLSLKLGEFFANQLINSNNKFLKVLSSQIKIIPQKHIEKIYSVTPAILKSDKGYWRENLSADDYERRIKENLIKKYNQLTNTKMDEDFQFITAMTFDNKKPISMNYKDIKLLGDKITLHISENKNAQILAYLCLGSGLLEMNSRGAGFVNFRWI